MDDIARRVGVSRTTVSFVLNDRPNVSVSLETRRRIHEVAAELGYRPHAGARALAAQRSGLIGMVTEIVTSPFGPEMIKGAQDAAWRAGKFLLIAASEGDHELERRAIERLLEQRVEGLIFASSAHVKMSIPPAFEGVPTILVHASHPEGLVPSIIPDEVGGGEVATRHLLDAGHRRIGMVNVVRGTPAARGRLDGYIHALSAYGVDYEPQLVVHAGGMADDGYEAASGILDRPNPPTALFCATDRMAMGAYDAIKERGLSIPGDVAVVGFDDQELVAGALRPKLTTVALPFASMGAQAVTLLGALIAGKQISSETLVTCPLVQRASA
ncbi:MAG: LacI family DNA-binding transcriptional regulator [Dermatophilaceae bacterium]